MAKIVENNKIMPNKKSRNMFVMSFTWFIIFFCLKAEFYHLGNHKPTLEESLEKFYLNLEVYGAVSFFI